MNMENMDDMDDVVPQELIIIDIFVVEGEKKGLSKEQKERVIHFLSPFTF